MALNFPDSPSNGDAFEGFVYNSSKGVWNKTSSPASSVTVYANLAAFPSSGNTVGDYAFATDTKALYIWDGSEWDRITTGGSENPRFSTVPSTEINLNNDGSNTELTIVASDPEGFPITYSHDTSPASPNQVTNIVNHANGVFTVVPSTNQAHAGTFTLRLKASDGVDISSHTASVQLAFTPGLAFKTLFIAHTGGTTHEVTGGTNEAGATDLTDLIQDTVADGDLIYLNPASGSDFGHFKFLGGDGAGNNPFANKQIAIVGAGLKPNNIFFWQDHDSENSTRDHPLFQDSYGTGSSPSNDAEKALTYRQFMFNLTYHRHRTSGTNYENAITKELDGGGTIMNCILDLNNGDISWRYHNAGGTTYRRSFKHCTFLNYANWDSPYSGSTGAVRVIDCAFDSTYHSSSATFFGTNQASVNVDGWKYDEYTTRNIEIDSDIAAGTYGHLKDINSLTALNTLFNTFQSENT